MMEDGQLLQQYARDRSESAFGELVSRHIDLVYAAALRVVGGDRHLAEDVTQMVFTALARKAGGLPAGVVLPGWLYRHTCYTAANAVRTERRRRDREQTAVEMSTLDQREEPDWERIAPHLDESLNQLSAGDRDAIVLRFLKRQDFQTVGAALGISEDAAQKRVSRALEKLRGLLDRRGVTLTAAALASVMTVETVTAAPAGLAVLVTGASLTSAAAAGTGTGLTTLKLMAMTKLKIGLVGAVLVAGLATPLVLQHRELGRLHDENSRMRAEKDASRQQADQVEKLEAENKRLAGLAAAKPSDAARQAQFNELLRLRGEVTGLKADAATNKAATPLADMAKSPEMKAMMKTIFAVAVDKSYGPLFTNLHLTTEQTVTLKDLILQKRMAGMDTAMSVLTGTDAAKRQEAAVQTKAEKAAIDGQINQFLGDDNYAQFQTFEKTESDRLSVGSFKDQLGAGSALNPDQEEKLVQAFSEERQNFKYTTDYTDKSSMAGDFASVFSEERMTQHQQEEEQLNQRYLARAQGILTPDQLGSYQQFLAKQQEMEATMMRAAAKMYGAKASGK
jgi:RNA polymerase sigma factor (sigma-70 family)